MKPSELVLRVTHENPERQKSQGRRIDTGVIPLDKGDPDFATPEHICDAAREAMRQGYTHYLPDAGDKELIQAIRDTLKEDYGCDIAYEGIIITPGGSNGIYLSCLAFLSPGDEAIIPSPTFAAYAHCVTMAGATPVRVPYRKEDYGLDREAISNAINRQTKAIILCSPNNPLGVALKREEVEFLVEKAIQHDLLLISDEVYRKIYFDGKIHTSATSFPEAKKHVILLDSFSKTYAMTGWRMGYIATTPELAKPMNILRKAGAGSVNAPTQRAAIAALRGPQDCLRQMVAEYDRRRKSILKILEGVEGFHCVRPDSAFYFFGKFDADMKSADMADYLYNNGVAVRSGTEYGENGEGYIRLAYCVAYQDVVEGIHRLAAAFKELT
jgi:aspartate/methionine/tyrosine aminotransferase